VNPTIYGSYRTLKRSVGVFDGLVEMTEIALREIEQQSSASGDASAFIRMLSGKHGIAVNYKQFPGVRWFHAANAIAVTHNTFDIFLDDFRLESISLLKLPAWDFGSRKDSRLEVLLRNMPCDYQAAVKAVGQKGQELAEYYRLVRNHFVHAHGDDDSKVRRQHLKLADYVDALRQQYSVKAAPSLYDDLQFEDVILFTRLVKDIASSLCQAAIPTDEQIAERVEIKSMRGMIGSPRLKQALMMELSTQFGLDPVDSDRIATILHRRLQGSPLA
jgi:hypothetical protein